MLKDTKWLKMKIKPAIFSGTICSLQPLDSSPQVNLCLVSLEIDVGDKRITRYSNSNSQMVTLMNSELPGTVFQLIVSPISLSVHGWKTLSKNIFSISVVFIQGHRAELKPTLC